MRQVTRTLLEGGRIRAGGKYGQYPPIATPTDSEDTHRGRMEDEENAVAMEEEEEEGYMEDGLV